MLFPFAFISLKKFQSETNYEYEYVPGVGNEFLFDWANWPNMLGWTAGKQLSKIW